jgi:hypothetical protein
LILPAIVLAGEGLPRFFQCWVLLALVATRTGDADWEKK